MRIDWYPKSRVTSLDRQWREVFGRIRTPVVDEDEVLACYANAPSTGALVVANWGQTVAGELTLDPGEPRPKLRELCNSLGLSDIVVFAPDLSWCAWAGHEDWDEMGFAEAPAP